MQNVFIWDTWWAVIVSQIIPAVVCYYYIRDGIHHIFSACFLPDEHDRIYANMTLRERITLVIDKKHLKREKRYHNDYSNFILLKRLVIIVTLVASIISTAVFLLGWRIVYYVLLSFFMAFYVLILIILLTRREALTGGDWVWVYDIHHSPKNGKRRK